MMATRVRQSKAIPAHHHGNGRLSWKLQPLSGFVIAVCIALGWTFHPVCWWAITIVMPLSGMLYLYV